MGKIDFDKFISSLIVHCKENRGPVSRWLEDSLADQCLRFDGDDLVESVQTPKWYKCIKEYRGFFVGRLYCTNEYGDLFTDPESEYKFAINISNPYFRGWFRPATKEEIEEISGNNGGISPNCELTEFEKALADTYEKYSCMHDIFNRKKLESYAREHAPELLDIARKQLEKEKVAQLKNTEAYNMGVADGAAEALKDMPKWRKCKTEWSSVTEHLYKGYYIDLEELFNKLPKEE